MYVWLDLKQYLIWCTFTRSRFVIAQVLCNGNKTTSHKLPAPEVSRDRSMQYIDIEYSIMNIINNEMTHKYSWKCYRTDIWLWFPVGCVVDKSYTTVDCVSKRFCCYYWNWTLKMWKVFWYINVFSWIDLSDNAAAILKSTQNR